MKNLGGAIAFVLLTIISISCGRPLPTDNVLRREGRYNQSFVSTSGFVINEDILGRPKLFATCFLADKFDERGMAVFLTANHFFRESGAGYRDTIKLFFNGRVYKPVSIVLPDPLSDIAVLVISDFPVEQSLEPLGLGEKPKAGDAVYLDGFHNHGVNILTESDTLRIYRDYYGYSSARDEVVHEILSAKVDGLDVSMRIGSDPLSYLYNYTRFIADNHDNMFLGFSGSPLIDKSGHVVGVISRQRTDNSPADLFAVDWGGLVSIMQYVGKLFNESNFVEKDLIGEYMR